MLRPLDKACYRRSRTTLRCNQDKACIYIGKRSASRAIYAGMISNRVDSLVLRRACMMKCQWTSEEAR